MRHFLQVKKQGKTRMREISVINNTSVEVKKARNELSLVEESLKHAIKLHAEYIDNQGKRSSGAKGLALQVNTRIKKAFEHGRDEMSLDEMLLLKSLLVKLERIITLGEQSLKTRRGIKNELYSTISQYGELVTGIAA